MLKKVAPAGTHKRFRVYGGIGYRGRCRGPRFSPFRACSCRSVIPACYIRFELAAFEKTAEVGLNTDAIVAFCAVDDPFIMEPFVFIRHIFKDRNDALVLVDWMPVVGSPTETPLAAICAST